MNGRKEDNEGVEVKRRRLLLQAIPRRRTAAKIPHIVPRVIAIPSPLHQLREGSMARVLREAVLAHAGRLGGFEEGGRGHQDVDGFGAPAAGGVGALGLALLAAAGVVRLLGRHLGRGLVVGLARGPIGVAVIAGTHDGLRGVWKAGPDAHAQVGCAVPHAFDPGGEAAARGRRTARGTGADVLLLTGGGIVGVGSVGGVLGWAADEVGAFTVHGVVDGVADGTSNVPKVSRVALLFRLLLALLDDP